MAKRSRGTTRPGQRRPTARTAARPGPRPTSAPQPTRPSTSLTEAEAARAAELEEQMVAEERAAETTRRRDRVTGRGRAEAEVGRYRREGSPLAARAAEEYTYVVRDVRRIATVAGALLGVMAVLFVLIEVVGVVKI